MKLDSKERGLHYVTYEDSSKKDRDNLKKKKLDQISVKNILTIMRDFFKQSSGKD